MFHVIRQTFHPFSGAIRDFSESYSTVLKINVSVQMAGSALFFMAFLSGQKKLESFEKKTHTHVESFKYSLKIIFRKKNTLNM